MIQLTWDWRVVLGVIGSGLAAGYFLGPLAWEHRPTIAFALTLGLAIGASFFLPLAVFRYFASEPVELQATVMYGAFSCASAVGLWVHR